jgi:hypothetical protein
MALNRRHFLTLLSAGLVGSVLPWKIAAASDTGFSIAEAVTFMHSDGWKRPANRRVEMRFHYLYALVDLDIGERIRLISYVQESREPEDLVSADRARMSMTDLWQRWFEVPTVFPGMKVPARVTRIHALWKDGKWVTFPRKEA